MTALFGGNEALKTVLGIKRFLLYLAYVMVFSVLTAWGFTTGTKQVPFQAQIDELLFLVDYSKISLTGRSLTIPAGMELDLGAVGKGYTADLVTEIWKEHHVESGIISLGENIQAIGSCPDGRDWRIGVRAPCRLLLSWGKRASCATRFPQPCS